jgi:DNA-binding response OmpR family regulator
MTLTVLTIEDQADIRRLICMTLEFKGIDVIEASNGAEGLRLAKSRRPDIILLDVMMPGIDGLTVCATLAEDPDVSAIPVIMISAQGRPSDIDAGLARGARAYLIKPFSPWELLNLVAQLSGQDGLVTVRPPALVGTQRANINKGGL